MTTETRRIVFYDGECGVCNHFVQFLLERDTRGVLHYAPLQGKTYADLYGAAPDLTTVVLRDGTRDLFMSDAVLTTLSLLGGGWRLVTVCKLVPRFLRDAAYRLFAKHRHRVAQSCRLPTPDEKRRFLP